MWKALVFLIVLIALLLLLARGPTWCAKTLGADLAAGWRI
jgi:hypothetical protein